MKRQLKTRDSSQSEHLINTEHYNEESQEEAIVTRFKNIFSKNI